MTTDTLFKEPLSGFDDSGYGTSELAFHSEFPQVKLPFQITIGGLHFEGISISLTKALVSGQLPSELDYQDELVSLRFDFDGFSVTLFADAILSQDASEPGAPISVFFTHPTDGHLAPLRYLINSFIAGDTITLGQLLSTGAAPSAVRPHVARKPRSVAALSWRVALFGLLGFLFALAAVDLTYQRLILTQEPRALVISQQTQNLRATASGQIAFLNPGAAEGDVAFTLVTNDGNFFSLRMPCACKSRVADGLFEGATVLSGDTVLTLVQSDTAPIAQTRLSQRGLTRHLAGDQAEVVFTDGRVMPVALGIDLSKAQPIATVRWPDAATFPDQGQIAQLRFNKLNGRMAQSLKSRLSEILPVGK